MTRQRVLTALAGVKREETETVDVADSVKRWRNRAGLSASPREGGGGGDDAAPTAAETAQGQHGASGGTAGGGADGGVSAAKKNNRLQVLWSLVENSRVPR